MIPTMTQAAKMYPPTPAPKPHADAPSREAIAKRAYELYLQRGSESGYELEDWLTAEAELIAAAVETAGS
jgi:DUF2934 family protein